MNRNMLVKAFIFVAGAAIGSVATWKVVKTKYEQISREEIKSVKEEYGRLTKLMRMEIEACRRATDAHAADEAENGAAEESEENDDDYPDDDDRDFTEDERQQVEYHKLTSKYRTNDDEENDEEGDGSGNDDDDLPFINGPYVISPEEFSSSPPGYSAQPLDYFTDGILADGWGVKLDIDDTIGEDALEHFGEYVDDIVYVRNERLEIDYEVTKDPRTYYEAAQINPNPYYGK